MYFANDTYGKRIHIDEADNRKKYVCPACKNPVIQKCGKVVAHHFAHRTKENCDPWYSKKMSSWHREMQNLFPRHCQEVVVRDDEHDKYHIADVVFNNGTKSYVVEFQHSTISYADFVGRTNFYINQGYGVIWIFDFCDLYLNEIKRTKAKTIYYTEIKNSNWIKVAWPGRDRILFLDRVNFSDYGENLHIYFHVSTGKSRKRMIERDGFYSREEWEYINPFQRERLFIKLHLGELCSLKEFFAIPYSEEDFYKKLRNADRRK